MENPSNSTGSNFPPREDIALDMLERYTGMAPDEYASHIILTNFDEYIAGFLKLTGAEIKSGSAMDSATAKDIDCSIIKFGMGSPNAALIVDLVASIGPEALLFLGLTGGLKKELQVGDFILPIAAIRDEGASIHYMPTRVPALPAFKIQKFVSQVIVERGWHYHSGVVHTTDYRFWEYDDDFRAKLKEERALCIDMECATLFVSAFKRKVPLGALLLVSDIPRTIEGIKTKSRAHRVFSDFRDRHLDVGIETMKDIATRGEELREWEW
ncbi:MAG: AMP nucleosidase [Planctomycetes bacterium]|nr:AMP nucleosidase [Planctomycetota bacterium]